MQKYGCGMNKKVIAESEEDKLSKLTQLDENNLHFHQIKLLFANGMGWGLRGAMEHAKLAVMHVVSGKIEEAHEYKGLPWYAYENFSG